METEARKMAKELLRNIMAFTNALAVSRKSFACEDMLFSKSRFKILFIMNEMDVHTIVDMQAVTKISESTLSIHMSRLVGEGYLRKERPKENEDGRKKYFYLTEEGKAVLDHIRQMILNDFAAVYSRLSEGKKVYLYQGIKKLHNVFDSLNESTSIDLEGVSNGQN